MKIVRVLAVVVFLFVVFSLPADCAYFATKFCIGAVVMMLILHFMLKR